MQKRLWKVGGIGISSIKGRNGGISRKKWVGKRDLRTLLWTLWFPLLSAWRLVEFDTSVIRHVFMHCLGLFQGISFISGICFWGTKYEIYRERVAYLHSTLWRRTRLWLELFASTVGRSLSRISYLLCTISFGDAVALLWESYTFV